MCISVWLITCNKSKKNTITSSAAGCVPKVVDIDWYNSDQKAPLFEGLDAIDFPISTSNPLVQKYFNQGMVLAYGFNHAEAARSFHYASKLDPECAMAYWGFAYVLGPNYNAGMESDNYERAYEAIQKALSFRGNATEKEQMLIAAMAKRYTLEPPEDRTALDVAYAEALKDAMEAFDFDPNIGTLYGEALMGLHPWDLWEKNGTAKSWTTEILAVLENVLEANPKHPGAHHFYIHAVEASGHPERGLKSAKAFDDDLVAGAGHLVHMPSHIYIRTGDYHKGTVSNIRSVEVDSTYVSSCHAQGAYPLAYYPHNYHFLAATATLEGNSYWAIKAAQKVSDQANRDIMKEPGWGTLQHYYTIPYYINVKFGRWDEILKMNVHDISLKYPVAVQHYARGMAYVGKGQIDYAKGELAKLEALAEDESLKEVTIWDINDVHVLMQIARRVLKAEILSKEGQHAKGIKLLQEAVAIEDQLNYDEPPDWFFSVRHHLGAIQIEAGYYQDAIDCYQADLARLPKNGWALHGIELAYRKMNKQREADEIKAQLEEIWATADVELEGSRVKG